jgi:hypothetical protein
VRGYASLHAFRRVNQLSETLHDNVGVVKRLETSKRRQARTTLFEKTVNGLDSHTVA